MENDIAYFIPRLAEEWGKDEAELRGYLADLDASKGFVDDLNAMIRGVPEFASANFKSPRDLRLYRCMLYLHTRAFKPEIYIETGVLNGFSTAFLLLAMEHNGTGALHSVDIPPPDERIIAQGTTALPRGKMPGWAIPENLRGRHTLHLVPAEFKLPELFGKFGQVDVFLHDSDHAYSHVMFEMGLAWRFVKPGGWIIVDNVEQHDAFENFKRGVGAPGFVMSTFEGPSRLWQHGLLKKI